VPRLVPELYFSQFHSLGSGERMLILLYLTVALMNCGESNNKTGEKKRMEKSRNFTEHSENQWGGLRGCNTHSSSHLTKEKHLITGC